MRHLSVEQGIDSNNFEANKKKLYHKSDHGRLCAQDAN